MLHFYNPFVPKSKVVHKNRTKYYIALACIMLTIIALLFIYRRWKNVRNSILLVGLRGAGKSLIFTKLVYSKFATTFTSFKEKVGEFPGSETMFRIVDLPGHIRLRNRYFNKYKASARGIIFVINSISIPNDVNNVCEYLYEILTDPVLLAIAPKILILCSKQDDISANSSAFIKTLLEKGMNALLQLKSNESKNKTKKNAILGSGKKRFEFSDIPPYSVDFCESHVNECNARIDSLMRWLNEV